MQKVTVETLLATRQPWVPDWPLVRPGFCTAYLGSHFVTLFAEGVTDETYDAYLAAIERAIRDAPENVPGASIFHMQSSTWWERLSLHEKADRMRAFKAIMIRNEDKMKRVVQMSANIATSALARAALRTLNAFRAPVVPTSVVATAEEAWRAVCRSFPDLDTVTYLAAHATLVDRYAPSLATTVYRNRLKRAG